MDKKTRIDWIDVLKLLGIYAIYLGHFGEAGGKLYLFVFSYHVPLFFFISGFFFDKGERTLLIYIKQQSMRLLIPYVLFSIIALLYFSLLKDSSIGRVYLDAKSLIFGIRNRVVAGSLWFIPCLFAVSIVHNILYRIFTKHTLIILVSTLPLIISQFVLTNNPIIKPSWIFNIDSAMYYLFYYSLGALTLPLFTKKYSDYSIIGKILFVVILISSLGIAIIVYFKTTSWFSEEVIKIFPKTEAIKSITILLLIPISLGIININIVVAKLLQEITILKNMGKETLVYCGTENVVKGMIMQFLSLIGFNVTLNNPIQTMLFTSICLFLSYRFIVPLYKHSLKMLRM